MCPTHFRTMKLIQGSVDERCRLCKAVGTIHRSKAGQRLNARCATIIPTNPNREGELCSDERRVVHTALCRPNHFDPLDHAWKLANTLSASTQPLSCTSAFQLWQQIQENHAMQLKHPIVRDERPYYLHSNGKFRIWLLRANVSL